MSEVGLLLIPDLDAGVAAFLKLFAACYGGLLALYFVFGGLLHWVNRNHPERRIQSRPQKNQIAMEIRYSVVSLASIALYLAGGIFVQAKGWTVAPGDLTVVSAIVSFVVSLVLYDAWFYWGHRLQVVPS